MNVPESHRLVIRSSTPGQQAFLNLGPGGSQLIDYVDVADNGATGQDLAAAHSIDSGNTTWLALCRCADRDADQHPDVDRDLQSHGDPDSHRRPRRRPLHGLGGMPARRARSLVRVNSNGN